MPTNDNQPCAQALQSEQAAGKARERAMLKHIQEENAAQTARLEQESSEERAAMLAELASAREAFERAVQQERQKAGQATAECGHANKRAQMLQVGTSAVMSARGIQSVLAVFSTKSAIMLIG